MIQLEKILAAFDSHTNDPAEWVETLDALSQVLDRCQTVLDASHVGIWLGDEAAQVFAPVLVYPEFPQLAEISFGKHEASLVYEIASLDAPRLRAPAEWPENEAEDVHPRFEWTSGAPLKRAGHCVGALIVFGQQPMTMDEAVHLAQVELLARYLQELFCREATHNRLVHMHDALLAEQERLLHIQVAIRQILEQPDLMVNLTQVGEALQALGWRRTIIALFDDDLGLKTAITGTGVSDEHMTRDQIVPQDVWKRLLDGSLEDRRLNGLYYLPHTDSLGHAWCEGDLLFAPLKLGQGRLAGIIRFVDPVGGDRPTPDSLRPLDILASQTAYIVENARLLDEKSRTADVLADQVEELSMIHRADRELGAHLNVDRIMTLTMDWALRRTRADSGLLALMTENKRGLVPLTSLGYISDSILTRTDDDPWPLDQGVLGEAARTGKTQVRRDLTEADSDFSLLLSHGAASIISIPLSMRGEVLGVIALASNEPDSFDEHDISFLQRLARRAAVALDNARLFRQSEQLADDMAVLYSASRAIMSTLERDEVLQRIAQSMTVALECSSSVIFGYRTEIEAAQVLAVYKLGTARDAHEVLPDLKGYLPVADYPSLQRVVTKHHTAVLRASDPMIAEPDHRWLQDRQIQALLMTPLIAQGELLGVAMIIEGRRERSFSPNEIFKAETVASQASVALRQSLLYSEVLELEKMKSEMIRMASHDLRNPLNNIMGYVELLAMNLDQLGMTPDQAEYIDSLRRSTKSMQTLIHDLLTLERIESEGQREWEAFDLGGLVVEVVEAAQSSAALKQQTLTLHRAGSIPFVKGNVTQLRQASANLVDNAIKYTPEGGTIEVTCDHKNGRLQFAVRDSGYGISPERQRRLFERFYRAREPGTDHIAGTGLGLSLVKTVIDRHGGEVWFTSSPGEGSTFGYWIPTVPEGMEDS